MRTIALFVAILGLASAASAQDFASPIYKLPADAGWAEYTWNSIGNGSEVKKGKLKISVGKRIQDRDGPRRWVEFAMLPGDPNQPSSWRKVLLDETAFERDRHLRSAIRETLGKQSAEGEYKPVAAKEKDNLISLGVDGKLRHLPLKSPPPAPLKLAGRTFETQFAEAESLEGRKLYYRVWLTPETPFGWVRFMVSSKHGSGERLLFEAELAGTSRP